MMEKIYTTFNITSVHNISWIGEFRNCTRYLRDSLISRRKVIAIKGVGKVKHIRMFLESLNGDTFGGY